MINQTNEVVKLIETLRFQQAAQLQAERELFLADLEEEKSSGYSD